MKARVLPLEEVQVRAMLATVHDDAYSECGSQVDGGNA
jgi:hypothetical protein